MPFCSYKQFNHSPILILLALNITWNLLREESSECQHKAQHAERPRSTVSIKASSTLFVCWHPQEPHSPREGKPHLVLVKSSNLCDSDHKRNLGSSGFSISIQHTSFTNPFPAPVIRHAGDRTPVLPQHNRSAGSTRKSVFESIRGGHQCL